MRSSLFVSEYVVCFLFGVEQISEVAMSKIEASAVSSATASVILQ